MRSNLLASVAAFGLAIAIPTFAAPAIAQTTHYESVPNGVRSEKVMPSPALSAAAANTGMNAASGAVSMPRHRIVAASWTGDASQGMNDSEPMSRRASDARDALARGDRDDAMQAISRVNDMAEGGSAGSARPATAQPM